MPVFRGLHHECLEAVSEKKLRFSSIYRCFLYFKFILFFLFIWRTLSMAYFLNINVNLKMYSFDHLRMYNIDHINTCCSRW